MNDLFSSDSLIMRWTSRLGDLVLLNLCFLLCCVPLVTAGAAWSALYAVCSRFGTSREGHPVREFFRAFRGCLRQGIPLGLATAAAVLFAGYFTLVFLTRSGEYPYIWIPFAVLLLVVVMVAGCLFPLLGLFENTWRGQLKNAVIFSLGYLPRSLAMAAVNLLPLALLLFWPEMFLRGGAFWALVYFSAAAYVNTFLLRKILQPYLPQEDGEDD